MFKNNLRGSVSTIYIFSSPNNILRNNVLTQGVADEMIVDGSSFLHYVQDIDESNTADSKPIYYWVTRRDATIPSNAGYVALINSTNITVERLDLKNHFRGILLINTTHSLIANNNITDNTHAIWMNCSSFNSFSENNITRNSDDGVYLELSDSNSFIKNNMTSNGDEGVMLTQSSLNNISENNITAQGDGVWLFHASLNTISGNDIRNCSYGIEPDYSDGNTIFSNNITMNNYGIALYDSDSNVLFRNNITSNKQYGVFIIRSNNNKFYHNNFRSNGQHVRIYDDSSNIWDNGYPSCGNHWDTYVDNDVKCGPNQDYSGADGIWDKSYTINSNNRDTYALINPIETTCTLTIEIWITGGGMVDPAPNTYTCPKGITVLAIAIPDYWHVFYLWVLDSHFELYGNPIWLPMDQHHELTAVFLRRFGGCGSGWASIAWSKRPVVLMI
jgi:parallel beta-helix repeat protein